MRRQPGIVYIYVMQSDKTDDRYVGITSKELEERIGEHNAGKVRSTKNGIPLETHLLGMSAYVQRSPQTRKIFEERLGKKLAQ